MTSPRERFRLEAVLDNLSASGLFVRLDRPVEVNSWLFFVIRLSEDRAPQGPHARVAARSLVVRSEAMPDGSFGLAVKFRHIRFLSPWQAE
jgi:hypothetical protein